MQVTLNPFCSKIEVPEQTCIVLMVAFKQDPSLHLQSVVLL